MDEFANRTLVLHYLGQSLLLQLFDLAIVGAFQLHLHLLLLTVPLLVVVLLHRLLIALMLGDISYSYQ